jgi:hypothetical protein
LRICVVGEPQILSVGRQVKGIFAVAFECAGCDLPNGLAADVLSQIDSHSDYLTSHNMGKHEHSAALLNLCCRLTTAGVIGPFFFHEKKKLIPVGYIFHQDRTPVHIWTLVIEFLYKNFTLRWIT